MSVWRMILTARLTVAGSLAMMASSSFQRYPKTKGPPCNTRNGPLSLKCPGVVKEKAFLSHNG